MTKTPNNEFHAFCLDNHIFTVEDKETLFGQCKLILSFLYEHDLPLDEESYRFVANLHSSKLSDSLSFEQEWLDDLKTIRIMPPFGVLAEVRNLIEETIHTWVVSR